MSQQLRVHSFLPLTVANGPGARCCLWLQGCSLGCPGCFNPETHSLKNGGLYDVSEVLTWIENAEGIEGLTVSGGEPLEQASPLMDLLALVRARTDLYILVFTGFSFDEVQQFPFFQRMQDTIDVLVAGRFVREQMKEAFPGSLNKTIHHFSSRYDASDLAIVPVSEVIISRSGELSITGVDPVKTRKE